MNKQIVAAGLLAAGLVAAGSVGAAIIDIGTGAYSTTIGVWGSNTLKQQDKLFTLVAAGTNLAAGTVVNFTLNKLPGNIDLHTLQWVPAGGPPAVGTPLQYDLKYTVQITPDAIANGATYLQGSVGVDTSSSCPNGTPGQDCSIATKTINDGVDHAIQAYQGANPALGVTPLSGTFITVTEHVVWTTAALLSVSNTFTEKVPEPATLTLLGLGLAGLGARARARTRKA
jgi:hypothetical protein